MPGDIRIAHIMVQPRGRTAADSAAALARIDSVRSRLEAGEGFAALAAEYSDDRGSASSGGALQRISYDAGLPDSMRDAAYATPVGQVTDVLETPFGFHLVKVLERYPKETFKEAFDRLAAQVPQMPRAQQAEEAYSRRERIALGGRIDSAAVRSLMVPSADSLLSAIRRNDLPERSRDRIVAVMTDSSYSLARVADFFENRHLSSSDDAEKTLWSELDRFLNRQALEYQIAALEENDADFARTMREFRDGLMLFRLMEDSVWTAASADSIALEAFYAPRADSYRFPDRVRAVSVASPSDSLLQAMADGINAGAEIAALVAPILADSTVQIRVDTTFISQPTNSVFDQLLSLAPGDVVGPVSYNGTHLLLYHDGVDPARVKTFEEARPEAVNDYQAVLEKRLLNRLRAKYAVKTYPERLDALVQGDLAESATPPRS
jgi:peptidyl-prolyl cis-trans isomerase SurA